MESVIQSLHRVACGIKGVESELGFLAGAEAFRKDIPDAQVQFLDTGHFALETHVVEIAAAMNEFLHNAR